MRTLEELGIGRPSTYASIIGTILDRGYVFKKGTALVPTFLAFSVVRLLEQHFGRLVDYDFTARDGGRPRPDRGRRRAAGRLAEPLLLRRRTVPTATKPASGLHALVSDLGEIDAREVNSLEIGDGIVLRVGRYGPYLERGGERASVPEDIAPDELTVEKAEELLAQPSGDRELGIDPETGRDRRAQRPLRAVRHRGAARRREGEAAHRVAVQDDVARHDHARGRASAARSCRA